MPLVLHPFGGYRFLPGIQPYSCGVAADHGFEIVHVTLQTPLSWRLGFQRIEKYLADMQRPKTALCAMELRSPRPFTFPGFAAFNAEYAQVLRDWGIFVNDVNPVARTNVAPELAPPTEPSLYAFSWTRRVSEPSPPTFVVAGAGELPEGVLERDQIVGLGNTTPAGLRLKAEFVLNLMRNRLAGLEVPQDVISAIDVYTVHSIGELIADPILTRLPAGRRIGLQWHFTRPPIVDIEFEMDIRGVRTELQI